MQTTKLDITEKSNACHDCFLMLLSLQKAIVDVKARKCTLHDKDIPVWQRGIEPKIAAIQKAFKDDDLQ